MTTCTEHKKRTDENFGETQGHFTFWNGDKYNGEFVVLKDKQKLVMEGKGIYTTAENEIYEGIWENDELKEAERIVYKDKCEFSGELNNMAVEGVGRYKFKEKVLLECEFENNVPRGHLHLTDPGAHVWKGEPEMDTDINFCLLAPLHQFWQSVLSLPHKNNHFNDFNESAEECEENFIDVLSFH
ncbi:hypothetical protein RUM44_008921 [Polyplax serrata]|uniref:MORN repeat-containing protein 5 n=1 Tax=Polyplax serrata TaxID=468196 RepID=A0ABR1ARG9_POLSC